MTFTANWSLDGPRTDNLCLGIDPSAHLLDAWGLPCTAGGAEEFGLRCVEAAQGQVAAVKPQIAYFEQFAAEGFVALQNVLAAARDVGLFTIADVKRNDIGSTMQAYAHAYLAPESPLAVDAVTANPYLGLAALEPMLDLAVRHGRTVFVLVRTSNVGEPNPAQSALLPDGRTVPQALADEIAAHNRSTGVPGTVGAVIGATVGHEAVDLVARLDGAPVLAPGIGAQGGTVAEARKVFSGPVVLPVSRAVLSAGPDLTALRHALTAVAEDAS